MDGYVVIGTELDTKEFDAQIEYIKGQLEDIEDKLKQADMGYEVGNVQKLEAEYEKLTNKLKTLVQKKEEFNRADFSGMSSSIKDIGKNLTGVIKKVARWGLAIFGIRSAYLAVRSAMNILTQDDEQLKADIDYIKTALAYTIEPVVRGIVNLVKQVLVYIGWIIKQWTGKNIFENANKSLKKSVGSAKELKKQLAGFDEMNVLSDTSSAGGGGGTSPSIDLAKGIDDLEPPEWLVKIKEIGQWIIDNWQTVVFGLLLTKLFIDLLTGNWIGVIIDFIGLLIIAFFKIKDALKVIWESVVEIWGMIKDWIITKMGEIKDWVVEKIENIKAKWQEFKDNVKEIWQSIINWIVEKWTNFTAWISNIITKIGNFFTNLWKGVKDGVKTAVDWIKDKFNSIVTFFSNIISKITGLFKTIGTNVGNVLGGAFKGVINGVLKAIENILNSPIRAINGLINAINEIPGINLKRLKTFSLPRLAKGGIVNMPSRGVPIGGAIAGERGAEGVIPLTDSQQMALLGEAIGKYININATVPVYVGNRMVAKELKRINAEDDFAYNR